MLGVSRTRACTHFKELRQADPHASLTDLLEALRVPDSERQPLADASRARTDAALLASRDTGMRAIPWFDPGYPALLNCVSDPPPVLWTRGLTPVLSQPAVAIIG